MLIEFFLVLFATQVTVQSYVLRALLPLNILFLWQQIVTTDWKQHVSLPLLVARDICMTSPNNKIFIFTKLCKIVISIVQCSLIFFQIIGRHNWHFSYDGVPIELYLRGLLVIISFSGNLTVLYNLYPTIERVDIPADAVATIQFLFRF